MQRVTTSLHHVITRPYVGLVAPRKSVQIHRCRFASQRARHPSPSVPPRRQNVPPVLPISRAVPLFLASLVAGAMAFYGVQLVIAARRPCPNPDIMHLSAQKDVSARYDATADSFDSEVGLSEMLMGVNRLRKKLARECKGHVLEVSCGTGRNLGYFDLSPGGEVDSLTFVDLSPSMVEVCRRKWDVLFGSGKKQKSIAMRPGLVVRFMHGSALGSMPPSPGEKGKYDTVVQTMGLCSTPQPVELVENMTAYLDTSKDSSRILLLEHGRSYQAWLNNILDSAAEKHAEIHGCWFNRDIGALVEEAAERSGLEVVRERRYHLGTTWVFELKPKAETIDKTRQLLDSVRNSPSSVGKSAPGWFSWLPTK